MNQLDVNGMLNAGATQRDIFRAVNGGLWVLLCHIEHEGRIVPVYACGSCYRQRYTVVTSIENLPRSCPMCGEKDSAREAREE